MLVCGLIICLCRCCGNLGGDNESTNGAYIGPSWSWVSTQNSAHLFGFGPDVEDVAKINHARSYSTSTNRYGAVSAAWIQVTGPFREATLRLVHRKEPGKPSWTTYAVMCKERYGRLHFDDREPEYNVYKNDVPCYLSVGILVITKIGESYHCLILVKSDKQQGAFRRIGLYGYYKTHRRWRRKTVTII